jgi:hypothetical protein
VLYNGGAGYPDKTTLRLSDAFELVEGNAAVNLELTVKVYNIGKGRNTEIVQKSAPLSGYVDFVHIANESRARIKKENPGMNRDIVLEKAIAYTVTSFPIIAVLAVSVCKTRWRVASMGKALEQPLSK